MGKNWKSVQLVLVVRLVLLVLLVYKNVESFKLFDRCACSIGFALYDFVE